MGGGDLENVPVVGNGVAAEDLSATTQNSSSRIKYATESERKAARLATDKRSKDKAKAKKAKDKEEQRAKDIKFRSMEKRVENDAQRKKTLSEATAENASLKAVIASLRKYKTNLERLAGSKVQQQVSAQKKLNREIKLLKEDKLELKSANAQLQEEVIDLVRVAKVKEKSCEDALRTYVQRVKDLEAENAALVSGVQEREGQVRVWHRRYRNKQATAQKEGHASATKIEELSDKQQEQQIDECMK